MRKLLHKMEVCGAISHKMGRIELQVDGTQLLIYYYIHVYIMPYFHWSKMIIFLGSLLQCIGQNFNFLVLFYNCLA